MLTTAQLQALKAAILADPNCTAWVADGSHGAIAEYLRGPSTFVVWKSQTATQDIYDGVTWANLTPTDAADGTATYTNRALVCQAKQLNLQILLQGRDSVNSSKSNIRTGLQDALTNVPSGAGGALVSAGWTAVRLAMQRFASLYEKVYATGTGTQGSPGALVIDGWLDDYLVVQALTQV